MIQEKPAGEDKTIQDGKIFAVIGYLGILCIIPLLLKKDNKFALFHGKQGLILFIGEVGAAIVNIIPFFGHLIWVLSVLIFGILSLTGIIQSLMGNYWKAPVIGDIAGKISI